MEPRFEAVGIPEGPQLAPRDDERGLDRVFGQVAVAQDPMRDRHASVADVRARASKASASPVAGPSDAGSCPSTR